MARGVSGVKWVRPALLHLTVKFLGDVEDDVVPEVSSSIAAVGRSVPSFDFTMTGTGCFPRDGQVRVIWAGIEEPTGTLVRCAGLVDTAMAALGFEKERRAFSPHVTLARVREDRSRGAIRQAVMAAGYDDLVVSVESLVVMSSRLSPQGPTYSAVSRHELSG
jgi:2'-5' RNA ligase